MKRFDKKRLFWGIVILILFSGVVALITMNLPKQELSDQFDEALIVEKSQRAIEYFNEKDYQSIIDMGDEEMKASITAEDFAEQCDEPMEKCGAFVQYKKAETVGATDEETGEEYGGVIVVAEYENTKVQFSIGFNTDMELIQFRIQ